MQDKVQVDGKIAKGIRDLEKYAQAKGYAIIFDRHSNPFGDKPGREKPTLRFAISHVCATIRPNVFYIEGETATDVGISLRHLIYDLFFWDMRRKEEDS
jgi:hypothetical protein